MKAENQMRPAGRQIGLGFAHPSGHATSLRAGAADDQPALWVRVISSSGGTMSMLAYDPVPGALARFGCAVAGDVRGKPIVWDICLRGTDTCKT